MTPNSLEAWQANDVLICDIEVWLVCHCLCHCLDAAGHLVDLLVKKTITLLQQEQQQHKS